MPITYFIFACIAWLIIAALRSLELRPTDISQFELTRRAKKNDKQALWRQKRDLQLPNIIALRHALEVLLVVAFIGLCVGGYGLVNGLVITFIALLVLPLATKLQPLRALANDVYQKYEPKVVDVAQKGHPVLRWLQQRHIVPTQKVYSQDEFLHLARSSAGIFSSQDLTLLENGLAFREKVVKDIMTPLSVIDSVAINDVVGPVILNELHKTGHSRFPVVQDDINHVVGMLYLHDLVPLDTKKKTVKDAMRPEVFFVRHDQTLEHALHAFLRTHHHLFIVVNEYRETVGLLSLEDVIEALLGRKIVDEFDAFHDLRAVAETNPRKNNQPEKREDV